MSLCKQHALVWLVSFVIPPCDHFTVWWRPVCIRMWSLCKPALQSLHFCAAGFVSSVFLIFSFLQTQFDRRPRCTAESLQSSEELHRFTLCSSADFRPRWRPQAETRRSQWNCSVHLNRISRCDKYTVSMLVWIISQHIPEKQTLIYVPAACSARFHRFYRHSLLGVMRMMGSCVK